MIKKDFPSNLNDDGKIISDKGPSLIMLHDIVIFLRWPYQIDHWQTAWKFNCQQSGLLYVTLKQYLICGTNEPWPQVSGDNDQCIYYPRANSRSAPSQWEMSLPSNAISHWLGANLDSALKSLFMLSLEYSVLWGLDKYHGCWSPGTTESQVISSHCSITWWYSLKSPMWWLHQVFEITLQHPHFQHLTNKQMVT